MKFAEVIQQSRSDNKDMAIFTKVIVHNLANQFFPRKFTEYEADLVENPTYTYDYLEAQNHISKKYNIAPLMVSLVAAQWNKVVLTYLSKFEYLTSKDFRFSAIGLFDMKLTKEQKANIDQKYFDIIHLVHDADLKVMMYFRVFSELVEDVYFKEYCFGLDAQNHAEMIVLLRDYLDFNFDTLKLADHFVYNN